MIEATLEDLKQFVSSLVTKSGFQISEEKYSLHDFGNAFIVLRSKDYNLRLIRDRGQVFVDISSPQEVNGWHDFQRVKEYLNNQESRSGDYTLITLDQLFSELKARHTKLRNLFEDYDRVKEDLNSFEKNKAQDLIRTMMQNK